MKINVIGDIHGRTCWKDLIIDDGVNVFVGDYFDPYEDISHQQLEDNFKEILKLKEERPETILLIGNHDAHYIYGEESSRYDLYFADTANKLLTENADKMQVAVAFGANLITHAGVSVVWWLQQQGETVLSARNINREPCDKCKTIEEAVELAEEHFADAFYKNMVVFWKNCWWFQSRNGWELALYSPQQVADWINAKWKERPQTFKFSKRASFWDHYGDSECHGPLWIRPVTLCEVDLFRGGVTRQIVGHSQFDDIFFPSKSNEFGYDKHSNVVFVDCLGTTPNSYKFEI